MRNRLILLILACLAFAAQAVDVAIQTTTGETLTVKVNGNQVHPPAPAPVATTDHTSHLAGVFVDSDTTKWPKGIATGISVERFQMTNMYDPTRGTYQVQTVLPIPPTRAAPNVGDIRNVAGFVGTNRLDMIVYPGQDGMAHPHWHWGRKDVNKDITPANIMNGCLSTSRGGILICNLYWAPAMIDTATHLPLKPQPLLAYYKGGFAGYMGYVDANGVRDGDKITVLPAGLVGISGNALSTDGQPGIVSYVCADWAGNNMPNYTSQLFIPSSCPNTDGKSTLLEQVRFGQCLQANADGTPMLDSPNHRSHFAFPTGDASLKQMKCPLDHPILTQEVEFLIKITLPPAGPDGMADISKWVLSSDVYATDSNGNVLTEMVAKRGASGHVDWMIGIEQKTRDAWANCLKYKMDCGTWQSGLGWGAGASGVGSWGDN